MPDTKGAARRRPKNVGRPSGDAVGEERIIAAAIELLKNTHPARLNRLEIARAANVDPALIRYYFGDMDRLLTRTAFEITEEIIALIEAGEYHTIADPSAALAAFAGAFFDSVTRFPHYHQLLLQQIFYARSREGSAYRKRLQLAGQTALRDIVERGIAAGTFRPIDTRYLEVALLGMCESMTANWPLVEDLFDESTSWTETAAEYRRFIIEMVLAYASNRPLAPSGTSARAGRSLRPAKGGVPPRTPRKHA